MSDSNEWRNFGEQISRSVQDAIHSGDFAELNKLVGDAVHNALGEAGKGVGNAFNNQNWKEQQRRNHENELKRRQQWQASRQVTQGARAGVVPTENGNTTYHAPTRRRVSVWSRIRSNRAGKVSNVLWTVFGGIGLGISGLALLVGMLFAMVGFATPVWFLWNFGFIGGFSAMLGIGAFQRARLRRAEQYIRICGDKMYADIKEIARQTGKSEKYVKKDLRKMIRLGIFAEGHIDRWETSFMLTDEVYRQYQEASLALDRATAGVAEDEALQARQKVKSELDAMVMEGNECIRHLHELNDAIPDEGITEKLSKLEGLLNEIFARVQEHPEQMSRMHKVMNYYLPTTVKLVEAYADFDKVSVPGQDINAAKEEIDKTLGVINDSFAELLNNLFQDSAFDVTTDAQVLQSMLAREGLAKEPVFATMDGEQ